jgi:SMC interacting uncharacterized protein involved in chromosome segregation
MNEGIGKIIKESMDKSHLQGKIIILHKLINELKSTVRGLEEELEKIGVKDGE